MSNWTHVAGIIGEKILKSYYVRTIDENNEIIDWFAVEENAQNAVNTVRDGYDGRVIEVFSADGIGLSAIEADDVWV